jgi:hypothetical protein
MNQSKQFNTPLEAWLQFQEQLWDSWLSKTQLSPNIMKDQLYSNQIKLMEELINCSLRAQSDWVRSYTKGLGHETGASIAIAQWAEQNVAMSKMWTNAQKQVWDTWFNALKLLKPIQGIDKGADSASHMFQGFQDVTKKALEAQSEWMSQWLAHEENAEPETRQKKIPTQDLSKEKKQAKSAA